MKKYGDDADSFHDQGTRVEISKKWHEEHQLKHNYSNGSVSKPKYSYNHRILNKSNYKQQNSSIYDETDNKSVNSSYPRGKQYIECKNCRTVYNKYVSSKCPLCFEAQCSKCGESYDTQKYSSCPYCNHSINRCSKCGKSYEVQEYSSCPYCNPSVIRCSNCGRLYDVQEYSSCPNCNYSVIICSKCGNEYVENEYDLCPYCKSKKSIYSFIILLLTIFFIGFFVILSIM